MALFVIVFSLYMFDKMIETINNVRPIKKLYFFQSLRDDILVIKTLFKIFKSLDRAHRFTSELLSLTIHEVENQPIEFFLVLSGRHTGNKNLIKISKKLGGFSRTSQVHSLADSHVSLS